MVFKEYWDDDPFLQWELNACVSSFVVITEEQIRNAEVLLSPDRLFQIPLYTLMCKVLFVFLLIQDAPLNCTHTAKKSDIAQKAPDKKTGFFNTDKNRQSRQNFMKDNKKFRH